MFRTLPLLLLLVPASFTNGYVGLPPKKQIKYLKELTGDICQSPAGQLSDEMIKAAPHIMKGWSTSKSVTAENAVAVENLVKRLVDESKAGNPLATPLTKDYNFMLESWARSGEGVFAAERCEQILTQMQSRYEEGDSHVQPNLSSFKVVIMAWRQSGADFAPYRAQRILSWMIELYKEGKNDEALPDSDCFDIVLQSWSKSDNVEAGGNAEKLLGQMNQIAEATQSPTLRPNFLSFNAVLGALCRSRKVGSTMRATEVLSFMEKLYYLEDNERVEPDAVTYKIVLGALARCHEPASAPKSDEILRFIEENYKAGNLSWEPDTILFNSVMGCWGKSHRTRAYRKARSILDRQLNLYTAGCKSCRPDVFGFTSVLSSCASEPGSPQERRKAFNVALSTYKQLENKPEEFGKANHVTYGAMMKACARLLPQGCPERTRWTKNIFEECKQRGLVGDMVLNRTRDAATPKEYKALLEGHTKGRLPKSWSRNVRESTQYRRKVPANRKRAEV